MSSAQLEELDYRKLYEAYSSKGRKSVTDPRVLFKVMAYEYQCGIYSTRKLEEACKYRVDFMWLAIGFNLKKRWMKQQKRRLKTHYSEKKAA